MKLPHAPWREREGMRRLLDALCASEGRTRFVGGAVRDSLIGELVSDVDLATDLPPDAVMERLRREGIKTVPTGISHGTVTAVLADGPVEVTTLRRDVSTDGRRATIAYTDDWKEDAARRDFTINALSADPIGGDVYDYFEGLADLRDRRVRFIGDPLVRIAEDHLRILRFFRFHARFGAGAPDPPALEACTARANDLMALSRERIADELTKLLALPNPAPTAALMVERGILAPILPEIGRDGVERLMALVQREASAGVAPDPVRRLAALLPADPQLAASVAARLRLSNKAARRLASAADPQCDEEPTRLAYRIGTEEAVDRLLLRRSTPDQVASLRDWRKPRFPLSGGDLIAMGLSPGPLVAKTLQAIERDWVFRGFPVSGEAVRALAQAHVQGALRAGD